MTLEEAIGVKLGNTDIKTGKFLDFSEVYGRAIDALGGLNEVARYIPFSIDTIRKALKEDVNLNNTSLSKWERAAGFECGVFGAAYCQSYGCRFIGGGIWELYQEHGITSASYADGVCILKEAARLLVEREGE